MQKKIGRPSIAVHFIQPKQLMFAIIGCKSAVELLKNIFIETLSYITALWSSMLEQTILACMLLPL